MQTHPIKSEELVRTVSQLNRMSLRLFVTITRTGMARVILMDSSPGKDSDCQYGSSCSHDTIDAMTTDRPYRQARRGVRMFGRKFIRQRGRQFDPEICDRLLASPLWSPAFLHRNSESQRQYLRERFLGLPARLRRVGAR